MDADVEDIGIFVPDNMVYAMTVSPDGIRIYGLTYRMDISLSMILSWRSSMIKAR